MNIFTLTNTSSVIKNILVEWEIIFSCGLGVIKGVIIINNHALVHTLCIVYLFLTDDDQIHETRKPFIVLAVQQNKDPLITKQL